MVPAIIGLPLLGAFLMKLFELFLDLFLRKYTFRLALGLAYIGVMIALFLAFAAAIAAAIKTVYFVGPPELSKAIGHFMPEAMPLFLSAYGTVHMAEFVLDIKSTLARAKYNYLSGK